MAKGKGNRGRDLPVSARTSSDGQPRLAKEVQSYRSVELFSGPLPPPDLLAKYNEIVPNAAERILRLVEIQTEHRHSLEKAVVDGQEKRAWVGMVIAGLIGLSAVIGGTLVMLQGYDLSGWGTMFTGLATLVGVFIYGNESRKRERIEKTKILKGDQ